MRRFWFTIIPFVIFVALAITLWFSIGKDPHVVPSPLVNKNAPQFSAPSLFVGKPKLDQGIFKGKVTLLNVFASWCITCRAEHPILMDIAASHQVQMVGVNYKDQRDIALKWLKQYGDPYNAIAYDPTGQIGIDFGVYGTPETFLIDKHGVIRYKNIGAVSPRIWKDKLLPMIKKLKQEA